MSKPVPPHHIKDAFSVCETLQSAIVTAMNDAVAKKDIVAAIPVPGIALFVRQLILDVKTESQAFQQTVLPGANVRLHTFNGVWI
ncbi:hypothetical protein BJ165DRAFT_1489516 [Panaeolus papilionaceus]|nr:hypothetical protein BJ165DRAFT_1489516 [Panaeolus papilionaceus]